jgi:hypothetical protein
LAFAKHRQNLWQKRTRKSQRTTQQRHHFISPLLHTIISI